MAYGEIEGDDCTIVDDYVDGVPSLAGHVQWRNLGGSRTADILKGWTLSVNDTSTESHTPEERAALEAADIKAYICPLLIKDGRFVGAFGIHSRSPRVWTPDEIALVQEVADRIWTTLEHRKAEAELRANEERLAFLLRLNDAVRPLSDAGGHPGNCCTASLRVSWRSPRRLCGARGPRVHHSPRARPRRRAARRNAPASRRARHRLARRSGAARRSLSATCRRISGSAMTTGRRSGRGRSRRLSAWRGSRTGRWWPAFGVNHDTPRVWTTGEIELVRDVAERTWDAVERTRAEAALREQKTRLRLALEASAGGSWTWDPRTNDADWDDAFRARFGFTPEDAPLFETWLARVHVDDRPRMGRILEEILQTKDTWDHTYRVLRPDGAVRWMQSLGRADRDATGHVTRLTGLELDITERRRIEDAAPGASRGGTRSHAANAARDRNAGHRVGGRARGSSLRIVRSR